VNKVVYNPTQMVAWFLIQVIPFNNCLKWFKIVHS